MLNRSRCTLVIKLVMLLNNGMSNLGHLKDFDWDLAAWLLEKSWLLKRLTIHNFQRRRCFYSRKLYQLLSLHLRPTFLKRTHKWACYWLANGGLSNALSFLRRPLNRLGSIIMNACGSGYQIATSFVIIIMVECLSGFFWWKRWLFFYFNTLINIVWQAKCRANDLSGDSRRFTLLHLVLLMIRHDFRL